MSSLLLTALALAAQVSASTPATPAAAQPSEPSTEAPTVGASLDRTEAHVGDRLILTVSAVARAGVAVTLPAKLDLGKLEVLDRTEPEPGGRDLGDGRRAHRFVLGIAAYEVGELEIPPIELSYITQQGELHSVSTRPVPFKVRSLVSDEEVAPDVQPLRPPREALVEDRRVMAALRWTGIGVGSGLVLVIAALLVRRAWRRRRAETEVAQPSGPVRPPDEIAMEKLRALRAAGNFGVDEYRPFYFATAEVVRAYLGARYHFDALELTTSELIDELRVKAPHLAEPSGDVVRFLQETDLVKFAKAGSTDPAALRILDDAQAIVLSTAQPLEEVAQAISGPVRLPRPLDKEAKGG